MDVAGLVSRSPSSVEVNDCEWISEYSSASFDTDLTGIGSSGFHGDMGRTGVAVPIFPTTDPNNRYLIRLASVSAGVNEVIRLRGIRTLVTIRGFVTVGEQSYIVEREVVSPLWSFTDGNVAFHLVHQQTHFAPLECDPDQPAGATPNLNGLDTGLIYTPPFGNSDGSGYVAPGGGYPPGRGRGVGDLLVWRDGRFPWDATDWTLSELVWGPGAVVLYASVKQTSPMARTPMPDPGPVALAGMRPEDQFVIGIPASVYGRVAGSLIYEVLSCCGQITTPGQYSRPVSDQVAVRGEAERSLRQSHAVARKVA